MGQMEKIAEVLQLTPEELKEKFEKNTLNLEQITIVSECMDLSTEQTMKKFFPDFMYRRSVIRRKGGLLCREQG